MAAHFDGFAATAPTEFARTYLPRLPSAHIARRRLTERLLKSDCRLKLVSAPAGFGKSVLLNECAHQSSPDAHTVWLDCHGHALNEQQFCGALLELLGKAHEAEESYAKLVTELSRINQPLRIFIDDYPRQSNRQLDLAMARLLELNSAHISWWVSARVKPKWNLPKLFLQGDLVELEAHDLALTQDELIALLKQHRLELPSAVTQALMEYTEGWLAGVCLLLLHANTQTLMERLQANTPLLVEYVEREILGELEHELRQALLTLVHMQRFNRSLCDHLLENTAADALETLRAMQLFIKPLDSFGEWFGLWQPLVKVLTSVPNALPAKNVYVKACQWFAARGQMREAVEYALRAGQPEVAASFLLRFDQEQLLVGRSVSQFLKWRNELSVELFISSPRLIVLQAWALILSARLDEAKDCIAALGNYFPQPNAARQTALLAHWQALQGVLNRQLGHSDAREYCLEALKFLQAKDWSQRVLCHQAIAQQALAEGKLEQAQVDIAEALRLSRLNGSLLFEGLITLDQVQLLELQGELNQALELTERSLIHLQKAAQESPILARTLIIRGYLLACQGRDAEAKEVYLKGSHEAEESEDAHTIFGYLGIASLAARAGDRQKAFSHLAQAERLMQWRHVPQIRYQGLIAMISAGIWLQEGLATKARDALKFALEQYQSQNLLAPSGCYDLLFRLRRFLALADLMQGRGERARTELLALISESDQIGLRSFACECRFSLAETMYVQGEYDSAARKLREAFQEAQLIGLIRPLLDIQNGHRDWVRQTLPDYKVQSSQWVQRSHTHEEPASSAHGDEASPLSAREISVLKLIAQGLSNQEIAESLFISLHTVKTHARRINTKLGVARRTQAVARAKSMGVLA